MTLHSEKCPVDLEKFPALDLGGNFRIREYTPVTPPPWWCNIREFIDVVNMKEIWRNMWKIWRNMKKYVDMLDLALPYLYGPWDLEKFPFLPLDMGLETWKNSMPELPSELWDLEKFWASPHIGSGTWKNSELHPRLWDLEHFHTRTSSQVLGLGKIQSSASI